MTAPAFRELADGTHRVAASVVRADGSVIPVSGSGNGPLSALAVAFAKAGIRFEVLDYTEHAVTAGADAVAACYLKSRVDGREVWGVGMATSVLTATVGAAVSTVNQAQEQALHQALQALHQAPHQASEEVLDLAG